MTIGQPNNTARLFIKINKISYLCGLPNTWIEDVDFSDYHKKLFTIYRVLSTGVVVFFMFLELAAFRTQTNLSEKQSGDLFLFSFSHPILFLWIIVTEYYTKRIKVLVFQLAVMLKEIYNDQDVEKEMIKKTIRSSAGFSALFMMSLIFYAYDGIMQVIRGEGTFTTVITFWPDVLDTSAPANVARVVLYFLWMLFMTRACLVYFLIIATLNAISHQFKNLQSYFQSLDVIFQEDDLSQQQKEEKYELAFKVGIRMHSETLWCTRECQTVFNVLFSAQVFMVVSVLVLLMTQLVNSERTLENILSIVTTGICMLFGTGFIMWNAGDITVEAAELSQALYASGWHNCQKSAPRVRRLMIITMTLSQRPVILWGLGIVELSYRSYVSIVKSSYSVFSVLV